MAFNQLGAGPVVALTVEDNSGSWGLMKRLGMERREDLDYSDDRYDPPWRDAVVYAVTHDQWDGRDG